MFSIRYHGRGGGKKTFLIFCAPRTFIGSESVDDALCFNALWPSSFGLDRLSSVALGAWFLFNFLLLVFLFLHKNVTHFCGCVNCALNLHFFFFGLLCEAVCCPWLEYLFSGRVFKRLSICIFKLNNHKVANTQMPATTLTHTHADLCLCGEF